MQITLPENEITTAVKAYLIEQGIVNALTQTDIEISYLAKRKGGGLEARVNFKATPHAKAAPLATTPSTASVVGPAAPVPGPAATSSKSAELAPQKGPESARAAPTPTSAPGTSPTQAEASSADPGARGKETIAKLSIVPPNPDAQPAPFAAVAAAKAAASAKTSPATSRPFAHLKGPADEGPLEGPAPQQAEQVEQVEQGEQVTEDLTPAKPKAPTKSLFSSN